MKRLFIPIAVLALLGAFVIASDFRTLASIDECQDALNAAVADVDTDSGNYRNHGQMVRTAAHFSRDNFSGITEECHGCIMAGFAQADEDAVAGTYSATCSGL